MRKSWWMVTLWVAAAVFSGLAGAADNPGRRQDRNSIARVVTISQNGLRGPDPERMAATMVRLDRAASFRPDIAVLPEVFLPDTEERVPGPVTERLAKWARKNSSYVMFGLKTRSEGKLLNSVILLDRQGRVMGQYHKSHPTENELRKGISPGDKDPLVFETDFGTIGVQICFDVNWREDWKRLKEKGASIVFFPAAYPAARQLAALALMNEMFIVSSVQDRHARIYDITGDVLAASGKFQHWAGMALPLGKRLFEIDFHVKKIRAIQKKYGDKVEVKWYHEDDWVTLASLDADLTVDDLIEEFGLTPLAAYRERASRAIESARK